MYDCMTYYLPVGMYHNNGNIGNLKTKIYEHTVILKLQAQAAFQSFQAQISILKKIFFF